MEQLLNPATIAKETLASMVSASSSITSQSPKKTDITRTELYPPMILEYGRITEAEAEGFIKFLHCLHQKIENLSTILPVEELVEVFQQHWNIDIHYVKGGYISVNRVRFVPTYERTTLINNKENLDFETPTKFKNAADDYDKATNILGRPVSTLKKACIHFIAVLINRIYSQAAYQDIQNRHGILQRLLIFLKNLQLHEDFEFLRQGYHFKEIIKSSLDKIRAAIANINIILGKPPQIKEWLENYYKHSRMVIDNLALYLHHSIQCHAIPSDLNSHLQLLFEKYCHLLDLRTTVTLALGRRQEIVISIQSSLAKLKIHQPTMISLACIQTALNQQSISFTEAGYIIDYVLDQQSYQKLINDSESYQLTADQFLRELIYDPKDEYLPNLLIKKTLALYRSSSKNQEYDLFLLRQHVLRVDRLLEESAKRMSKSDTKASSHFINLADQVFTPAYFNIHTDTAKHYQQWKPGIFWELADTLEPSSISSMQHYFDNVCQYIYNSNNLAIYSSIVRELEWSCVQDGINTITVVYLDTLRSISQNSLATICNFQKIIENFNTHKRFLEEQAQRKSRQTKIWLTSQAVLQDSAFFRNLIYALHNLAITCKSVNSYLSGEAIEDNLSSSENSAELLLQISKMPIHLPTENLINAKIFRQELWKKLRNQIPESKESKVLEEKTPKKQLLFSESSPLQSPSRTHRFFITNHTPNSIFFSIPEEKKNRTPRNIIKTNSVKILIPKNNVNYFNSYLLEQIRKIMSRIVTLNSTNPLEQIDIIKAYSQNLSSGLAFYEFFLILVSTSNILINNALQSKDTPSRQIIYDLIKITQYILENTWLFKLECFSKLHCEIVSILKILQLTEAYTYYIDISKSLEFIARDSAEKIKHLQKSSDHYRENLQIISTEFLENYEPTMQQIQELTSLKESINLNSVLAVEELPSINSIFNAPAKENTRIENNFYYRFAIQLNINHILIYDHQLERKLLIEYSVERLLSRIKSDWPGISDKKIFEKTQKLNAIYRMILSLNLPLQYIDIPFNNWAIILTLKLIKENLGINAEYAPSSHHFKVLKSPQSKLSIETSLLFLKYLSFIFHIDKIFANEELTDLEKFKLCNKHINTLSMEEQIFNKSHNTKFK